MRRDACIYFSQCSPTVIAEVIEQRKKGKGFLCTEAPGDRARTSWGEWRMRQRGQESRKKSRANGSLRWCGLPASASRGGHVCARNVDARRGNVQQAPGGRARGVRRGASRSEAPQRTRAAARDSAAARWRVLAPSLQMRPARRRHATPQQRRREASQETRQQRACPRPRRRRSGAHRGTRSASRRVTWPFWACRARLPPRSQRNPSSHPPRHVPACPCDSLHQFAAEPPVSALH